MQGYAFLMKPNFTLSCTAIADLGDPQAFVSFQKHLNAQTFAQYPVSTDNPVNKVPRKEKKGRNISVPTFENGSGSWI